MQKRKQFFKLEADRLHEEIKAKEEVASLLQPSVIDKSNRGDSPTQTSIWENLEKQDESDQDETGSSTERAGSSTERTGNSMERTGSSMERSSSGMMNAIWDNINLRSDMISSASLAVWDDSNSSVSMTTPNTFKADQNTSEAKDILYPSSSGVNQFDQVQYQGVETQDIEKRELLGNSATEGQVAKDILYSSNKDTKKSEISTSQNPAEGQETKDLLYPSNQNISEAKDILYSSEVSHSDNATHLQNTTTQNIDKRKLLGNSATEGQAAKDILYSLNQDENCSKLSPGRNMILVEGQETKDLLYPSQSPEEYITPILSDRTDETRDLIYGGSHQAGTSFQTSRGMTHNEGDDMKSMLYPSSSSSSRADNVQQSSVWKSIDKPFHDGFSGISTVDQPARTMRQFERPSTIKKLMYPQPQIKGIFFC